MTNDHIYSDEHVSISASSAILEGIHFPIEAISDLFIIDRRPDMQRRPEAASPIFSILYSTAVFVAASLLALYTCQNFGPLSTRPSFLSFLIGGGSTVVLFLLVIWVSDRIAGPQPEEIDEELPDYTLVIGTTAGHRSAISSHDRWYIERIEGCIGYAMSLSARAQKRSRSLCSID